MVTVHQREPTRSAARARSVKFTALTYIRLPKAPNAWQERSESQTKTMKSSQAGVSKKLRQLRLIGDKRRERVVRDHRAALRDGHL